MQIGFTIDLKPADTLLGRVLGWMSDLSPVFAGPIDESVSELFRKQFDSEGAYGGERWAPLMPLTLKLRDLPGHGTGGVGRDTGRAWASLVRVGSESIREIAPLVYRRWTAVPYEQFQQTGWVSTMIFGRARSIPLQVPARPPIPSRIPDLEIGLWRRAIARYISGGGLGAS